MTRMKRLIASLLCLAMLLSVVPFGAFATETEADSDTTAQTEPAETVNESAPAAETPTETPAEEPTEEPTEAPAEEPAEEPTEAPAEEPTLPGQIDISAPAADASIQSTEGAVKVEHDGETTYYADLQTAFDGFAPSNNTYGGTYVITLLGDTTGVSKNLQYPTEVLDVTLDLNGFTITGPNGTNTTVVNINFGSTNSTDCVFTIKDSSGTNAGTISGGKNGVIFAGKASTFNFTGGTITNNHGGTIGGGIKLGGNCYFHMTGGVITGNSVTGTSSANTGLGGGIYGVYIDITGGAIYGNAAYGGTGNYTGRGGGICTDITGTSGYHYVNIGSGVSIYGNTADNAGDDLMIQKNSGNSSKLTFTLAGDNWYIDGMNGQNHTSTLTDRYSAENPISYTEGGWAEGTKKAVGLKYVVPSTPSVPEYTVTYTDGVEDEEVFADQVYTVAEGEATPAFEGTPVREGYTFTGWDPAVAETVTADATYVAQWKENTRGEINGVGFRDDNEGLTLELHNVLAYETIAVKVYSGETLLTTVSLRDMEENKQFLGTAQDALTVSIRTYDESSSWEATEWEPTDGIVPTHYELYIDGVLMDTHEEAIDEDVWNALIGTKVPTFTVTYTDGVEDEEVFADQVYTVEKDSATPAFEGTPARTGYVFKGWTPEVAETVSENTTYTAQWSLVVAQLESTGEKFETLQAAVDAAVALMVDEDGAVQTVTVLEDIEESVAIAWTAKSTTPATPTLNIDLNGKTVTGNGGSVFTIGRYGSYTTVQFHVVFKDSVGTGVVTGGTGTVNGSNTYGGAIYAKSGSSYITIEGGTWTENTATHGGVVAAAYSNNTNYITINGGTFTENTATGNGGALYGRYVFINGGTITGNTAASGGGVYVFIAAATKIEMTGGAVYGNTATTDGDDIIWRANKGTSSTAYMKLIDAAEMGNGITGWYVDAEGSRYSEADAVEFTDYANYTTLSTRVALKAAAYTPVVKYTVTYTDGVEDEEVFADQVYTVVEGEATPAFDGTPTRTGYVFKGWTPEVAATVTENVTYTASWTPEAPDKFGENVTPNLVQIICDSDEDHAPINVKWQSQSTKVRDWVSGVVWDEELNTWTVPVRIDSVSVYYVWLNFEKAYNDILHPMVNEEQQTIDTYLKWDDELQLWVTLDEEPIEVHTACKTAPDAPTTMPSSFQIQVKGDLDHDGIYGESKSDCALGISELRAVTIPEGGYTLGEVYGSREEGFFVDVTVILENNDTYITTWMEYCAPDGDYVYNWDKTAKSVTFTLKYNRSLTGTLYGTNKTDWAADFTGYKVGEAYVDEYIPAPQQANVTDKLVAIICDSDHDRHETVYGKWYPLGHCETRSDITWNAELGAYTVDVKIGSLYIMYVDQLEDANYGTAHELVEDITEVRTTLVWDAEQELWVTLDGNPIELHTTCRTAPLAPIYKQVSNYQIKVFGYVNGEENVYTTGLPEGGYTIGEVQGSREEGFTVEITVNLEDGDAFITNWIEKKNPGETYFYDWDKTEKTVTFTLNYNGDLNGTLYGNRHASNTNYDWVLDLSKPTVTYGVVSEAYIIEQVVVTYTDGVESKAVFADQSYEVFVGDETPAFQGTPQRNGYSFAGWTPEVAETVTTDATYVAQWIELEPVLVYAVTNGDKNSVEVLGVVFAESGVNLVEWLDSNVEIAERYGYVAEKWYSWSNFGTEIAEDEVVDVLNTVYVNYVGGIYNAVLDGNGVEVEPASVTVVYNEKIGTLPVPTRTLYTFQGWFDEEGNEVTDETTCYWLKDVTLTAKWVQNAPAKPYKITNVVSGVHVYWTAVEGSSKYGVWRSETGEDGTWKWLANPTVPHFTDTTAESGKTYYYAITTYDVDAKTHSEKSPAISVIYVETPDLTMRVNLDAGIGLGWNKIEGATGYAIYRKSFDGNDAWVRVATIEGNETFSWTDTSVKQENGTIYRYTIRALAGENMNILSGCRNTGRTMVRLTTRQLTSAVKANDTSIKCSWATSTAVNGYEIRFMVDGEVTKTFVVTNYKTGVKTFAGLEAGHHYQVQVRGYKKVDGVGTFYSAWSNAIDVEM